MPEYEITLTWTYTWTAEDVTSEEEAIEQALEMAGDHIVSKFEPEVHVYTIWSDPDES